MASLDSVSTPRLIEALRTYDRQKLVADLMAGLTVGLIALPLSMAFAISSGVPPQAGIYTAIVAGFLVSALGGSMTQIAGPTGAFVVVVAGIVEKYGLDGLYMCTLMAGGLLMVLGLTGLGTAVKYIPRPVVIGFTNGIAVLIASTQIKDFFGLKTGKLPDDFAGRIEGLVHAFPTLSIPATATASLALASIILITIFAKRIPGAIVALLVGTLAAFFLHLPLETIESKFGGIPAGLPKVGVPRFRPDLILTLLSPTLTVCILGAVESLLSAVVADRLSKDRHNSNTELFAQGVANFVSPFLGGIPATGAIARTAANIRSGAKTPVAGIVHSLTLLLILLVAAPLAKHVPLCILSAILFMVAYNMGEWREIPEILKLSRADIAVWIMTFALTVFADLSVAVEAGMVLAALLYIGKVTNTTTVAEVTPEYVRDGIPHSLQTNQIPDGVAVFRVHGPFLFGAADKLSVIDDQLESLPPVIVLRLRNMTAIDATGLHALESLADRLHATNRSLVLCGMRDQPARLMHRAEFDRHVGHENIVGSLRDGIERAQQLLAESGRTPQS